MADALERPFTPAQAVPPEALNTAEVRQARTELAACLRATCDHINWLR